ncbi:GIY-YIG nuclease family protein [Chenggangzhangella methanolivorans]|uniref:GIY-YIG nuclease family protein n=1 Tax=Chenggangzhangella methanolivorans TaxID=1437009 RepID=A0A9E6RDN2_9HYPH|nr:GIY-YIG nuclease family protein [Chenggangzhangella methanolivorans]QZO01419.1 GIY-YIG nuclease family protein [Chenggangzhangella methanolivorans]
MTVERRFFVYILASDRNGTLYVGMTSDLTRRVWQHREHVVAGFTKRYGVGKLVYFEIHATAETAIRREKRIKHWPRDWKLNLIERDNPDWDDLFDRIAV